MKQKGGAGNDTLRGGNSDDLLQGMGGKDVLLGGGGNDLLDGGAGDDDLRGGAGNDVYLVDNVNDITRSISDPGRDEVRASVSYILGPQQENLRLSGSANLNGTGNAFANTLTGNSGRNTLVGGAGNDTLDGGKGDDDLRGGIGNDTYVIDNVGDLNKALVDAGVDTVRTGISYALGANQENLTLVGSAALTADGNALANLIIGNDGDNVLDGGAGADTLNGGRGDDVLVFDGADVLVNGGLGDDRLAISGTGVTLDLRGSAIFNSIEAIDLTGTGNNALTLDAAAVLAVAADSHQLRVIGNAGDTVHVADTWQASGQRLVEGKTFVEYTTGDVTLQLAAELTKSITVSAVSVTAVTGVGGVHLSGAVGTDTLGGGSARVGDINGDGLADLYLHGGDDQVQSAGYIVFGTPNAPAEVLLAEYRKHKRDSNLPQGARVRAEGRALVGMPWKFRVIRSACRVAMAAPGSQGRCPWPCA